MSLALTPSLHLPSPSLLVCVVSLSLSLSSPLFWSSCLSLLLHRQSSLAAAAASFCPLFAANGPLVCCVQGNKSHQAGTQAPWLPLHVGQSGQFAMVWWAVRIQETVGLALCPVRVNATVMKDLCWDDSSICFITSLERRWTNELISVCKMTFYCNVQ